MKKTAKAKDTVRKQKSVAKKRSPKRSTSLNRQPASRNQFKFAFAICALVLVASLFYLLNHLLQSQSPDTSNPPTDSAPTPYTATAGSSAQFSYAGLPVNHTLEPILILTNRAYMVGYSESHRCPVWVAYRFDKAPIKKDYERHPRFMVDERTTSKVEHRDYTNSGYDRGHMAPSYGIAECFGDDAMMETYLMSNIAPQTPKLNRSIWKDLESKEVREYADNFETIWVVTGPIFDSNIERMPSGVEIPDAFFKILADEKDGGVRVLGFIIPQNPEPGYPLEHYLASVDEIELQTRLDFFSLIPDETEDPLELSPGLQSW